MTDARRTFLRSLMELAWGLYRAELKGPTPRTFADALSGAWRFMKRQATLAPPKWAIMTGPRHVSFGSMLQSPIRRSLRGEPYAGARARAAGYYTSMVGG